MKKRFLSIFTALALCMSLLPQMAWAKETVEEPMAAAPMILETQEGEKGSAVQAATSVGDEEALKNAIANGGEVVLQGSITLTSTLTIAGGTSVTLDLGTNTLQGNNSFPIIKIEDGGNLTLTGGLSGYITGGKGGPNGGGVYVASGGTFTMNGGRIDACEAANGGGVYVANGGTFHLIRGDITGCKATNSEGGGVYVESGGTMTMSGGEIYFGSGGNEGDSAGIYLAGTLNANGGTVRDAVTVADGQILTADGSSGTTFAASVLNNGTISGGSFSGTVTNNENGTITNGNFKDVTNNGAVGGGTFTGAVTNTENGMIAGGTFTGSVTNNEKGTITNGEFKDVTNNGAVEGGDFTGAVTNTENGTIKDGNFKDVTNNGAIQNGTFSGTVTNTEKGTIGGGTFTEDATVTNNGTITGGIFTNEISGDGEVSISGATVYIVKFVVDGQEYETRRVTSLDAIISAPAHNPTKTGYTFKHWAYNGTAWDFGKSVQDNLGAGTNPATDTITLTAVFEQDAKQDSGNSGNSGNSGGGGGKRTESKLDGKKYAEDGALSIDGSGGFGNITGFEIDGKSLNRFDCSGLDLRMSTGNTWMWFMPEAIKQLVDSDAESLTLVNGEAELKLPRAVLQQLLAQMGDEKLRTMFLTDEDVLNSLSKEQRKSLDRTLKNAGCRLIGAVTGEFMIGNRPVDWSKNRVEMEVSSPFLKPVTEEELMQWMEEMRQEMLDWRSEPDDRIWQAPNLSPELVQWKSLPDVSELENWSFRLKPDENDEDIFRFEVYPTRSDKKPYESMPQDAFYMDLSDDWDQETPKDFFSGGELPLTFEPNKKGDYFAKFQVTHFSTYLLLARQTEQAGEETKADTAQSFADVDRNAYYYDAVRWAAENDVTGGTGEGKFSPNAACTRAQIVTFLWRAAGSPKAKDASGFSDVAQDAYYAKAVAWAVENGITGGTGEGEFSPNKTCTRAQAVSFLHRAADRPEAGAAAAFTDVAQDAYYAQAVAWAAENDITGGVGGGLFGANAECTRAQIVTFLYRAAQ